MKVLVTDPIHEDGLEKLRGFAEVDVATELSQGELLEKVPGYDAMVVRSGTTVGKDLLDAADDLKLVVRAGVGLDNIDIDYADEIGVRVENTPEASTTAVAELTLGLMLSWARKIPRADRLMREGEWAKSELVGTELNGKTIGIVGTGRIGCSVAERAKSFGMKLIGCDIVENEDFEGIGGKYVELEELVERSDYITLHLPLTAQTECIIGEEEFDMMKDSAVIVNVARGGVLDEDALIKALENGEIGGACLDVYVNDPIEDGRLTDLENVILVPHLGASTEEAQRGVGVLAAERIEEILG